MKNRILLVNFDPHVLSYCEEALSGAGFQVNAYEDDLTGIRKALDYKDSYDLFIGTMSYQHFDGSDVLRKLRINGVTQPILIVTARCRLPDRIEALDAGADDYLELPLNPPQLIQRVEALLNHAPTCSTGIKCGNLELDIYNLKAYFKGDPIDINPYDFRVLEFFINRDSAESDLATMLDEASKRLDVEKHYCRYFSNMFLGHDLKNLHDYPTNPNHEYNQ